MSDVSAVAGHSDRRCEVVVVVVVVASAEVETATAALRAPLPQSLRRALLAYRVPLVSPRAAHVMYRRTDGGGAISGRRGHASRLALRLELEMCRVLMGVVRAAPKMAGDKILLFLRRQRNMTDVIIEAKQFAIFCCRQLIGCGVVRSLPSSSLSLVPFLPWLRGD